MEKDMYMGIGIDMDIDMFKRKNVESVYRIFPILPLWFTPISE
jgi:hypothetical protein